jgi:hypothetical protein
MPRLRLRRAQEGFTRYLRLSLLLLSSWSYGYMPKMNFNDFLALVLPLVFAFGGIGFWIYTHIITRREKKRANERWNEWVRRARAKQEKGEFESFVVSIAYPILDGVLFVPTLIIIWTPIEPCFYALACHIVEL